MDMKEEKKPSFIGGLIPILFFMAIIAGLVYLLYFKPLHDAYAPPEDNTPAQETVSEEISTEDTETNEPEPETDTEEENLNPAPLLTFDELTVIAKDTNFDPMSGVTVEFPDGEYEVNVVSNNVDTKNTGTYFITYEAKAKESESGADNTASYTRMISVCDSVHSYGGKDFGVFWDTRGVKDQPYLVAVNCAENVVTVYGKDELSNYTVPVKAFICSAASNTPDGYYRTLERMRWHKLYDDAYGQYAIRIIEHFLFHSVPYFKEDPATLEYEEYNKLGEMASQGCVRMQVADVKWIYDNAPNGFPAVIYRDDASPGPLGKPSYEPIDTKDKLKRNWDPTDPDPVNPWSPQPTEAPAGDAAPTEAPTEAPSESPTETPTEAPTSAPTA